jgi:hypothetical protein
MSMFVRTSTRKVPKYLSQFALSLRKVMDKIDLMK